MTWTPACMDAAELANWHAANRLLQPHMRATRPCLDCVPAFAAEMAAVDRCNGTPGASPPQEERRESSKPRRSHCIHGHSMIDDNIYLSPEGWRKCRICLRAQHLVYEQSSKERRRDLRRRRRAA